LLVCLVMTGPQIQTVLSFTYFPKSIIRVHIIVIENRGEAGYIGRCPPRNEVLP